ncbi:MAG: ankyrin repeat domain-containing protein, partial [Rhodospirillaceae bacterium]|nr:ankyrin repeat domain-containing protein [Rhodospirillaceae bacterium]
MKRLSKIAALLITLTMFHVVSPDSPLADAVEKKDHAAVRKLLEKNIDVNASQTDGMTALHWAAYQ